MSCASGVPKGSPSYLLSTYRMSLLAPLPAKIWRQGGIPAVIFQDEQFRNPDGQLGNYNSAGATITGSNAFFQSLGTNGRSCVTCHNPPSGMGLSLRNIKARFRANLNDPLFAPVDGANCPDAVPAQFTSGSLYRGIRGKGRKALKDAYSMLLTRGLIRIAIKVPANADYTVEVSQDRPGCNQSAQFNRDPVTGEQMLSMYRRPIFSANLRFKEPDDTANPAPTNVMWDGREPSLITQAISATLGHAQALQPPTQAQLQQIVDFETKFFTAQLVDRTARRLDAGATGGPRNLSTRSTVPPAGFPPPPAFDEYDNWASLTGSAKADRQAAIARGQALFNTRTFVLNNVAGFNDFEIAPGVPIGNGVPFTCSGCHAFPHAGSELVLPPQRDIGIGGQASVLPAADGQGTAPQGDLPVFTIHCTGTPHPFYGSTIVTNDPGTGLITGKCKDIGKKTVPALRGLASRAPYFSDGSAAGLADVVDFYNQRFNIALTVQEKSDLVAFLAAL